jgi:uncharacterized protein
VIVPDVNLLLYATDATSPHHESAKAWWSGCLGGTEVIGIPWSTTLAFLRLTTSPRIYERPLTADEAITVVRQWFALPGVVPLEPTARHVDLLADLLGPTGTAGNLVTDAHLAALAIENGAALHSADRDFGRFPGLVWKNPLAN